MVAQFQEALLRLPIQLPGDREVNELYQGVGPVIATQANGQNIFTLAKDPIGLIIHPTGFPVTILSMVEIAVVDLRLGQFLGCSMSVKCRQCKSGVPPGRFVVVEIHVYINKRSVNLSPQEPVALQHRPGLHVCLPCTLIITGYKIDSSLSPEGSGA